MKKFIDLEGVNFVFYIELDEFYFGVYIFRYDDGDYVVDFE